ncbi:MAG: hypothetical protein JF587_09865 [Catenulisporales bacterium]|nr:hypothetical protein [Catenulisporales bacterium]
MATPAGGQTPGLLLDEQARRSMINILTDLAGFFEDCPADAVNAHFDDLAAADWIPIVLNDHAQVLTTALDAPPQQRQARQRTALSTALKAG